LELNRRDKLIHRFTKSTKGRVELQDITGDVRRLVESSGVESGICYVYIPHTTAGVAINEHADPAVVEDIASQLEALIPQIGSYRHMEGNAPAHIKSTLTGNSTMVFIEDGKPVLGTWQGIFLCEFDGPRNRNVLVKIVADSS
jgi:secondary thiamine-phosphate synthase enzyme